MKDVTDKIYKGYQKDAEMVAEPAFPKLAPAVRAMNSRRTLDFMLTMFGLSDAMKDWRGHGERCEPRPDD